MQNIIPLPYFADESSYQLYSNVRYNNKYHRAFRTILLSTYSLYFIYLTVFFLHLLQNWSLFYETPVETLMTYGMSLCLEILFGSAIVQATTQHQSIQYLLTQACNLVRFDTTNGVALIETGLLNLKIGSYTFEETFYYGMIGLIPFSAAIMFTYPFVSSLHPLIVHFRDVFGVKLCASLHTGICVGYVIWYFISSVQSTASVFELGRIYTGELVVKPDNFDCNLGQMFFQLYRKYRKLQMLTCIGNEVVTNISFVYIYLSVASASVCMFASLKLHDSFPIFIYMMFPTVTLHMFGLIILFTKYADSFGVNIDKFSQFWKLHCANNNSGGCVRHVRVLG